MLSRPRQIPWTLDWYFYGSFCFCFCFDAWIHVQGSGSRKRGVKQHLGSRAPEPSPDGNGKWPYAPFAKEHLSEKENSQKEKKNRKQRWLGAVACQNRGISLRFNKNPVTNKDIRLVYSISRQGGDHSFPPERFPKGITPEIALSGATIQRTGTRPGRGSWVAQNFEQRKQARKEDFGPIRKKEWEKRGCERQCWKLRETRSPKNAPKVVSRDESR